MGYFRVILGIKQKKGLRFYDYNFDDNLMVLWRLAGIFSPETKDYLPNAFLPKDGNKFRYTASRKKDIKTSFFLMH